MPPLPFVITPPPHDAVASAGIAGLAVAVAAGWVAVFSRGSAARAVRLGAVVALVLLVSALAASQGLLTRFDRVPPPMGVMIALVLVVPVAAAASRFGRDAASIPIGVLVGFQAFRLPLELVMHHAAEAGVMPPELSYAGYNFDIVTGAVALALWVIARRRGTLPLRAVWIWNIWGIYCLCAIALIAVGTSPMVRLFGSEPRHVNTWVLYFPYVWLPVVLVTIAVASHVVITRKLLLVDHR